MSTKSAGRTTAALAVVAAGALIAAIAALRGAEEGGDPLRCAAGMIPLGGRCCGEGQTLRDGRCEGPPARCGAEHTVTRAGCAPSDPAARRTIAGGALKVGPGDWEAQGVVTPFEADIAPFAIDVYEVTEARWTACMQKGACSAEVVLSGEPGRAVAGVTFHEAEAFCRSERGRLPAREEMAFAISEGGRRYPWGDTGVVCRRAAWGLKSGPCATGGTGPDIAGAHPDGVSKVGVHDLAGNVAEWAVPRGPETGRADVVGGSWADSEAAALRGWNVRSMAKDARDPSVGFRCVYAPAP